MNSVAAAAGSASEAASAPPSKKIADLTDKLEKTACYARNEHSRFPWTNLLIGDTRLGCKSDADEQLILHFEFSEFVKVHSVKLTEFNNGIEPEENPTRVLLFVNRNNLGFEDIEDVDPTTTLELTTEDLKENADNLHLKFVQYQRVKSITIFVEDNNGGEVSALGGLKFYGLPVATTNMADFKKQG
mmetsp:Transcript_8158/g.24136  ORF Transcript_8158/g.24136 Transcript_8158/m.24136 type:complete len:187 (+) Transcript_8158:145-705(+)